jgi:hypothetical protein
LGGAGQGGEAVVIEKYSRVQLLLKFGDVQAKRVEPFPEGLEWWRRVGLLESLQDACGVAVERLARETLLVGTSGDVAVRPFEDGSGIGDTELRG